MESQTEPIEAPAVSTSGNEDSLETADHSSDGEDQRGGLFEKKSDAIRRACRWRDVLELRNLAESTDGLLSDELRRLAWPILLGLSPDPSTCAKDITDDDTGTKCDDWESLPRHRDEEQVQLDVNRSFIYYPTDKSDAHIEKCKSELSSLIIEVLRRHPYLCYFQGYHDICQVFLLALQPAWRARLVARLSVLRIRDFMLPSLRPTTAQLRLLPDILANADPKLRKHIATVEPFYALAGTLTMYAHNIEAYRDIARLFDVLLAREPVFTIYVFAQIVLNRRDELLDIDELDMLQVVLSRVPPNMDINALVTDAIGLFDRYPPHSLPNWRHISEYSSLKTARDIEASSRQTLKDGHSFFEEQTKEVRWVEMRERLSMVFWKYRRPIRAFSVATAVAAIAIYLQRNPSVLQYVISLFYSAGRP